MLNSTPARTLPTLIVPTAGASGAVAAGAGMLYSALLSPNWHGFFDPVLLVIINVGGFALLGLIGGAAAGFTWWIAHRLGAGAWASSVISALALALVLGGIYVALMGAIGPLPIAAMVVWAVACQMAVSTCVIRRTARS